MSESIRHPLPSDHLQLVAAWNDWTEQPLRRDASALLQKLFIVHFADTSFVAERDGKVVACLIGFLSQTHPEEAYVHFVGVSPDHRRRRLGRLLYERFFETCMHHGRTVVRGVTSPRNTTSLTFHARLGFDFEPGDDDIDGLPVHRDYDEPGIDMVLLRKQLTG